MKKIINKFLRIVIGVAAGVLMSAGTAVHAQNFSNMAQEDASQGAAQGASQGAAQGAVPATTDANQGGLSAAAMAVATPDSLAAIANDAAPIDDSKYTLGVNDVIEIIVVRHPEVSRQYIINSEGKIQYEFVGDVKVAGLTKKEAKDLFVQRLATYIVNPEVMLKIVGYNSKVVYIIGEGGNPGKIFMRGDTITIREALLQAGLPLLTASTRKCRLITPTDIGKAETKYVDVFALIYEGNLKENLVMKPGDTLYVPATIMAKAMRVISPVTQPVVAAGAAARPIAAGGI